MTAAAIATTATVEAATSIRSFCRVDLLLKLDLGCRARVNSRSAGRVLGPNDPARRLLWGGLSDRMSASRREPRRLWPSV
jgi:hypothetical protein